jgi:hypothetical protein
VAGRESQKRSRHVPHLEVFQARGNRNAEGFIKRRKAQIVGSVRGAVRVGKQTKRRRRCQRC